MSKQPEKTGGRSLSFDPSSGTNRADYDRNICKPLDGRTVAGRHVARTKKILADAMHPQGWEGLSSFQQLAVERASRRLAVADAAENMFLNGVPGVTANEVAKMTNAAERALRALKIPDQPVNAGTDLKTFLTKRS